MDRRATPMMCLDPIGQSWNAWCPQNETFAFVSSPRDGLGKTNRQWIVPPTAHRGMRPVQISSPLTFHSTVHWLSPNAVLIIVPSTFGSASLEIPPPIDVLRNVPHFWHAMTKMNIHYTSKWKISFNLTLTSVGPAYIIGEGKMATMVEFGSSSPSSSTAACCFMRQASGTSSSLVQPPSGCSSSTGRR